MEYIFETKNLKIRRFEIEDAQKLYKNHLEEGVKRWIPNESYANLQEAQGAIEFFAECVNERHLPFVLAVELKENGELIEYYIIRINKINKNMMLVQIKR